VRHPLAGRHQAGHGQERHVRVARLAAHASSNIAGGPKGDELNKQIMAGKYPGHRQDQARWRQPDRLPHRQVGKVGARHFFYYQGKDPSAVRYKNWKFYYTMQVLDQVQEMSKDHPSQ
jgi:hypothetical protein